MINYQYSGINREGARVKGKILADHEQDLESRLLSAGIDILSSKEVKPSIFEEFTKSKLTRQDVMLITREIALLLDSTPLMEVLDDLRKTFHVEEIRDIISDIYESMEGGDSFSEALQPYEKEFGRVYISLVSVGEQTAQLQEVLLNLEDMIEWELSLLAKAKKVMIYPMIVSIVVLSVVLLLMVFVVPELLSFIQDMGGELGFATTALIATSSFIQEYVLFILIGPFVATIIFKKALSKHYPLRLWFDEKIFDLKIVGPVLYSLKIARFSNAMAIMSKAGMGFVESMTLSIAVVENAYLESNIKHAIHLIESGEHIHEAFEKAKVMPFMGIRTIKVGVTSGKMEIALKKVSKYYDGEAKNAIDKIEPAIEPILTVTMAIIIGWVMMAVMGPIYETVSQVS